MYESPNTWIHTTLGLGPGSKPVGKKNLWPELESAISYILRRSQKALSTSLKKCGSEFPQWTEKVYKTILTVPLYGILT